jgi:hypothetical protein
MSGEVRQLRISGEAAEKYNGGKRGRTRKQHGSGLSNSPPGAAIPIAASNIGRVSRLANASNPFNARGGAAPSPSSSLPIPVSPSPSPSPAPAPAPAPPATQPVVQPVASAALAEAKTPMQGGSASAKAKLLLVPPKKKTRGVILAPAHSASASASSATHKAPASKKSNHKKSRKVRVHLSGMKKRLTKAKTIHTNSREKPIAEIRRLLEEAKLVKPRTDGKSVPDSVLRDIYKDYMLLRTRVL